ncbi:hypothetical protein Q31b_35050 [Novipirellula aureliae]|uniref:Uncharacterized protein n=1 Tax=Novipirellula aureliae TaxID=2527966 RepID=A0A5C6DTZ9_9BACT|nr:hypothetical protein [Novipirellula aureliae]TWU40160.1 hypothetical protein Q31b_35050 [Novipirellula aureliae]
MLNTHFDVPSKPVKWDGQLYTILDWGISNDQAYVTVEPNNDAFIKAVAQLIQDEKGETPGTYLDFHKPYTWFANDPKQGEP